MATRKKLIKRYVDSFFSSLLFSGRSRFQAIGIHCFSSQIWLFAFDRKEKKVCRFGAKEPGIFLRKTRVLSDISLPSGVDPVRLEDVNFFRDRKTHHISFSYLNNAKRYFVHGTSTDLKFWRMQDPIQMAAPVSTVVPSYRYNAGYLAFFGKDIVGLGYSRDFVSWKVLDDALFATREGGFFDEEHINVIGAKVMNDGILVIYDAGSKVSERRMMSRIGALIVSKNDPKHILWRCDEALWEEETRLSSRTALGACFAKDKIYVYFLDGAQKSLSLAELSYPFSKSRDSRLLRKNIQLERFKGNPILEPKGGNAWENIATLNPAALRYENEIHLLYRAIGADGVSRIGYAKSEDGFELTERLDKPIFSLKGLHGGQHADYDPVLYPSGGSWGGSEDPRAVEIEGRIYLTMSAFDGWDLIRMAVSSIDSDDLRNRQFNWTRPLFISPEGEIHKNWVLFPEKIKGKFAILHSIAPKISVEYVENLESLDKGKKRIKSEYKPFVKRPGAWEERMRGVGPPPIKTSSGWLLLYHAMDKDDPDKYKLGAMLLDLKDPRKVLARSKGPILEPDLYYENEGKPGIIYACGAVIKDGKLFVYYGGGDAVSCVATADLEDVLNKLAENKELKLSSKKAKVI